MRWQKFKMSTTKCYKLKFQLFMEIILYNAILKSKVSCDGLTPKKQEW